MNRESIRLVPIAAWLSLATLGAGCVSSRGYQQALEDNQAEIRGLREDRAALKAQIQQLKSQLDSARGEAVVAGAPAGAPAGEKAPEAEATRFPGLDDMGISYGMRDGNMVISIPSSITFPSGQATLSGDGRKALKEVAATLKKKYSDAKYSIEGHTDTDPIKKSKFTSNRELSVARAMAVLTYLVEECGIKDEQCIVAGHGQYDPAAPSAEHGDKARNRRVEIVVQQRS